MTTTSLRSETFARDARLLRGALGPIIASYLEDPNIGKVILMPDGWLWIDRLSSGLENTGCCVQPADADRIVRLVAHHEGVELHAGSPCVLAKLSESGERFEGLIPPVVTAPCFAIRRPAASAFTLGDYVDAGTMSVAQAERLRLAVRHQNNILVTGGTLTGKTTLAKALLAEIAKTGDRMVLFEDIREHQRAVPNLVALRTKDGPATLPDLVRSSHRPRPNRTPVGRARGAETLYLLNAWGTEHPGGVGTLYAHSAIGALRCLEQLIQEAGGAPRAVIADTIDIIAVLAGRGGARRLIELAAVQNLGPNGDYFLTHG